ncbi:MAG TPA: hypothetical protein VGN57_13710 [Pirellulaceae bacterium]|jgi:hypothetical protein|nr:hypothetical protein [Pirellulaceae bacterium]
MITSADYADWLDQSGLYLGNYSDAERYQTFEKQISPEGLNVRIVFDFLRQNRDGVDVQAWRNYHVYEIDGGLRYRIERTADALAAIGAPRASEAVRTSQNSTQLGQLTSGFLAGGNPLPTQGNVDLPAMMQELQRSLAAAMGGGGDFVIDEETQELVPRRHRRPSVESRDEIAASLRVYVERQAATLQADIDRHGDVRKQAGFDPARRQAELQEKVRRESDHELQRDTVAKMRNQMEQFEKGIAKHGQNDPRKLRSTRRKLLEGRRAFVGRPAEQLLPEMRVWLQEFEQFSERYASIFRPAPVDDPALLERLASLGAYEYDVQEFGSILSWGAPRGFELDWPRISLSILYPEANGQALAETLDVIDELRRDFPAVAARLRAEVLSGFRDYVLGAGGIDRVAEWIDVQRDENGEVPDAEILRLAGAAALNVESQRQYGEGVTAVAWFPVEWDEEHGLEVPLVGRGGPDDDGDSL